MLCDLNAAACFLHCYRAKLYAINKLDNFFVPFRQNVVSLQRIMCSVWFRYLAAACWLAIYLNRGLFVAMPGVEVFDASVAPCNEINSLLEVIMLHAGGSNGVDEDGDLPESYAFAKALQPVIDPAAMCAAGPEYPDAPVRRIFCLRDEAAPLSRAYGAIDHPPETA
jgi:hypothetical protein